DERASHESNRPQHAECSGGLLHRAEDRSARAQPRRDPTVGPGFKRAKTGLEPATSTRELSLNATGRVQVERARPPAPASQEHMTPHRRYGCACGYRVEPVDLALRVDQALRRGKDKCSDPRYF